VLVRTNYGAARAALAVRLLPPTVLPSEIIGRSFDTTASNKGSTSGACILLEQKLQRNLLHFACRHHVHKLIIGGVFTALFGPSRSPNIALFERFQSFWPSIDQQDYKPLDDPRQAQPFLQQLHAEVTSFLKQFLAAGTSYMPREDYKEMMELCLLILGESVYSNDESYHFRIPGANHLARWMGKVIYCFKIYLSVITSNSHLLRPAICLSSASMQVTYKLEHGSVVQFHEMLQ